MDVLRLGRVIRVLRSRKGWRQEDLAARAGVGRTTISNIELGRARTLRVATLEGVAAVLGLSLDLSVRGLGGAIDRLLDERHARLVAETTAWLGGLGWTTAAEVSYSEWGERGSIDLVAWDARSCSLVVIEVKSELTSLEATLRKHDEKARLAPSIVERRFGWRPSTTMRLLVLPEDRTQRRRVTEHRVLLELAYPARNRAVRAWLRCPTRLGQAPFPTAGLVFLSDSSPRGANAGRALRERVRLTTATSGTTRRA